jgi:hypothetical protein
MDQRRQMNGAGDGANGGDGSRPNGDCRKPQFKTITDLQLQVFLEALADSCNVRRAAAVAGFAYSAAYKLRQHDSGFAEAWQAALESGYARLEMALVERAILTIEAVRDPEVGGDIIPVVGAMTVTQAIDLMNKHRASIQGGRAKGVSMKSGKRPTAAETDDIILRHIAIIEQQRESGAKQGAQ